MTVTNCPHVGERPSRRFTVGKRAYRLCFRCTCRAVLRTSLGEAATEYYAWEDGTR